MLVAGGRKMTEAEWLACEEPNQMFGGIRQRTSDRKLRLLACLLCETYARAFDDPRSQLAVQSAYRIADGEADELERIVSFHDARDAALELDGELWRHSTFALPAYAAGTRRQLEWMPQLVLQRFDCNFYVNPRRAIASGLRELLGNPFRPIRFDPEWRTSTAVSIAHSMYASRDFSAMPILADALQDAGCDNEDILNHCRGHGPHVRGCWVVDLVLGKS